MLKKAILKSTIFCILLVLIISSISSVFILKTGHRGKLLEGLYNNGDTYDVVLMGSSHMNGGIDPNVLWNKYGITSFNYATGGQPLDVTYYLLKEVLKKHNNPIVVVDLYYLGLKDEYGQEPYVRNAIDNMKLSLNKVETIWNCTALKDRISYLFPLLKYHDRWKELTAWDFNYDSSSEYYAKGFEAGTDKYGKDDTYSAQTEEVGSIPAKTEAYLNKIIALSKEKGFKLVFTNTPYDYNSSKGETGWVQDQAKMFNKVEKIAESNGITFVNYCDKMDDINFDFKNDMNNVSHLNIWGANKVTIDFGNYLKNTYALADHRQDPKYYEWCSDYNQSQAATILAVKSNF